MANAHSIDLSEHAGHHEHDHAHEEHHQSFVAKYVFSQDHKMISRQFLLTAVVMAVIAMTMSIIFRMQLAWPGEKFAFINAMLGDKWGKDGILDPNMYLALVTIHGTIMVFFVLTGGLSGTFANLLIHFKLERVIWLLGF